MIHKQSETWLDIASRLSRERAELLDALLGSNNQSDSDKIRGKVRLIDEILNWPDEDGK